MKKNEILLRDSSRPFEVVDLFFSTTDTKGIITSCNDVFTRVAGYEPNEILGKPHNIVRHPHMPRCVFKLLWEYLLSGRSIGAYVKNLAKTGEYYWVFALATPCPGGLLSIRLKPTSPILSTVESLYKELLACEAESGADWRSGMAAATNLLLEKLAGLGFSSYDNFMIAGLRAELGARRVAIRPTTKGHSLREPDQLGIVDQLGVVFDSLDHLSKLQSGLATQETFLVALDMQLNRVAINSGVRAAHLGDAGRSLGVIGEEIARVSRQVGEQVVNLKREAGTLGGSLALTAFNVSLALLQSEMSSYFAANQKEQDLSESEQIDRFGASSQSICALLDGCATESIKKAFDGIVQLGATLGTFDYFLTSLTKILLTIQFAYVTGKTQAARIEGGETFARLLSDLRDVSESSRGELERLGMDINQVKSKVDNWREYL